MSIQQNKESEAPFDPRKHIKALVDDQHIKFSEEIYRDLLKQSVTGLTEKDVQEAYKRLLKKHKESSTKPTATPVAPTPSAEEPKKAQATSKS